jgi:3-oxoacyl-[acyl-carrier-protein] synthase III
MILIGSDHMKNARIIGTGHYVPDNIITNDDLAKIVDTNDEWIVTRSGIKERRISNGETNTDLATKAALMAMEDAGIKAEELDLIIVATVTADSFTPSASCMVQSRIGAVNAAAFDINAACTGFIYGISVAQQFIRNGQFKNALIIGAEVLSKIVNWEDRSTCVLFGDGAGAAILADSEEEGILGIHIAAEGQKGHVLKCDSIPVRNPYVSQVEEKLEGFVQMEGKEVFKFATKVIGDSVERLLESSGLSKEDIDYIIPHQANIRIIDFAAKRLGMDISKFYTNIDRYGNTSSASIGIALDEMNKKGMLKPGNNIILVGFGGGLTYGSILIKW